MQHDGISAPFILPRKAGKGDRAAQQRGGRGVGGEANPLYCTPPPPCCAWSPSPALGAGADKQHRSRDALRARVMQAVARSEATKQSSQRCRTSRRLRQPNRPTGLPRFARNDEKEKRKRNADRRVYPTSAPCGAARVHRRQVYASLRTQNPRDAPPIGVPPRLLRWRPNATAQLRTRASWDAATRLSQSSELLADRS